MKRKSIFAVVGLFMMTCLNSCNQLNTSLSNFSVEINSDGYWVINGEATNVKATGEDGHTPVITIGANGNWFVDGVDTNVTAKGENGTAGANGVSIVSIAKTGTQDNVDTYTITYSDNSTTTFTVTNGVNGEKGDDGHTPVITIGANGNWFVNGVDTNVTAKGENGAAGANGVSIVSIAKTGTQDNVDTYTITYSDNSTTTFTVTNGVNGEEGEAGKDGENAPHYGEKCTVTFDAGNGNLPTGVSSTVEVTWGDCLTLPTPTYAGYNFVGWFTGDGVNDKQFTNYDAVFKDITLYAKYEEIHYILPSFAQLETGVSEEYYLYGETVNIVAKETTGKSFDYWVNNVGGRDYNVVSTYTFGGTKNVKNVVYRDEATVTDGFEGNYIATFDCNGEQVQVTISYDGKGYYELNSEGTYSLSGYANLTYTTYYTGLNENLYFESFGKHPFTFENAKFNKDVTMADGNTYSYLEAKETNLLNKDVKLWLNGNEYVEQTSFAYAGTLTGSVTKGDYEGSTISVVLDKKGNGTYSCDGTEVTTLTYSSYDESTNTYTLLDENGEECTIVTASDGTITIKYSDYRTVTVTFEAAKYKYYGKFIGSYSDDEGLEVVAKLVVNEDGTGTYYENDYKIDTFTITSSESEDNITLHLNGADEDKKLKYDSTSGMYSGRLGDTSVTNYVFTSSYKDAFSYAGTYTGTDSNDTECVIVLNADWTGTYSEDGTKVLDLIVTSVDETSNVIINLEDSNGETYTLTKQTSGTFKGKLGDGSVVYTYVAA